ncbi:hypothetical protein TNIN_312071 [Trichonephila inaurata madagascariensis]|uniref:Uncharacterized protein n=1 Tax=Trichonephila inaurata madagascariensis TaxID=2747483 RepID=A0A8X6I679_9ARAC|nr:hypothetical protein TNIN_312071 [Trichonephila inaurata madagascariensis]
MGHPERLEEKQITHKNRSEKTRPGKLCHHERSHRQGGRPLKKHLKGKRFNPDDVLKDTVKDWVSSQPQEFWEQGILLLVHQWDRCAQAYGVYFE